MAKDPAFLFYPGDWLQGTMGMTLEEQGGYLQLLIFQFNKGKFTKAQARQVLSTCSPSAFEIVLQKFDTDGNFFWKQRLSDEIERRKKFTESRRVNAKSKKVNTLPKGESKAYAQHMETVTEIEDVTVNRNTNKKEYFLEILKDELWVESVSMTHRGKNVEQAAKEAHDWLMSDSTRYINSDHTDFKKIVIGWLSNKRNGADVKKSTRRKIPDNV